MDRNRRIIALILAGTVLLIFLLSWITSHAASHRKPVYVGNLQVTYKPSGLLSEQHGNNTYMSVQPLESQDKDCVPSTNPIGSITRIDKDKLPNVISTPDLQAAKKAGTAKEFPAYWLVFNGPQAACSPNPVVQKQQAQATVEAKKVFDSVK